MLMNAGKSKRVLTAVTVLVAGSFIWAASPAFAADVILPPGSSTMPAGAIDCTPRTDGSPIPRECTQAPGQGSGTDSFDLSKLPGIEITPGTARTATIFNLGPLIAAIGPYASLAIFYVDFGDGTGFGNSGDLKTLSSFPSSHVYVNPGDYTVAGFASMDGKTESTYRMITIAAATQAPAAATETKGWQAATAPAATAVIPVTASDRRGALDVGTAVSTIVERMSRAASRNPKKAPRVTVSTGQTTLVNIPGLTAGTKVTSRLKIGNTWTLLPATEVQKTGIVTLPALTFTKAGTYLVELRPTKGASLYVQLIAKKG